MKKELGDPEVAPLPDALLPPAKLREYLGPTAARTVMELDVGAVSDPVRTAAGFRVLEVLEREPTRIPPLAEIEELVRTEVRRRRGDEALRAYLDQLRGRAETRVARNFP